MPPWDRSPFAISPDELEVAEAIRAVERVVQNPLLKNSTRATLLMALDGMRDDSVW